MAKRTRHVWSRWEFQEKGAAYILVLVFMLVGALVVPSLLTFMRSGLNTTLIYQNRTRELYAANAGVKEAIWNLKSGYSVPDPGSTSTLPLLVNNVAERPNQKTTNVSVFCMDKNQTGGIYRITSAASTSGTSNTTVEAWVETHPFLMDYAIITPSTLTSTSQGSSHPVVNGSVAADVTGFTGDIHGRKDPPWDANQWPFNVLQSYYEGLPGVSDTVVGPTIDVGSLEEEIGPGHSNGDLLFTGDGGTLRLTGTIYVHGDLDLAKNHNYTLDLNFQTIYVEGEIYAPPDRPTITGSGCIIAVGDINFQPMMSSQPGDYVFVMSTQNTTNFQPNGDYYGTIAGKVNIHLSPSNTVTYTTPPANLTFPGADAGVTSAVNVVTWNVSPPFSITDAGLYIETSTLPEGSVGVYYSQSLSASGGTPEYAFSIHSGSLPDGLSISDNGTISGTPGSDSKGISAFIARVTDADNRIALRSLSISIASSSPSQVISVTTDVATNISGSGATLNGTLTSMGAASSVAVSFEYGLTTGYGQTLAVPPNRIAIGAFSGNITGLVGNTPYHYRAKAVAGSEIAYGSDQTFTTLSSTSAPPVVYTTEVTLLPGGKTFRVEGLLTDLGSATNVTLWVQWLRDSTVPADEMAGVWVEIPPAQTTTTDFFHDIGSPYGGNGKWPTGHIYHFRVMAIGDNGAGTAYGEDVSYPIP